MARYIYSPLFFVFPFMLGFLTSSAQKLPNIQQVSVQAPTNVKIDGRATEWNSQFQAYNKATDVFYTIANNDNYLYLAIQTKDPDIIAKIFSGRISFTINKSGKKNSDDAITVSYPIISRKDKPGFNLRNRPELIPGSAVSLRQADSFMNVNNKQIDARSKTIKVTGVKGLDTLISVYNEDGIKAAGLFDNNGFFTCEIAVSLKLAGLSEAAKFSYNVMLNPAAMDDVPGINIVRAANGTIMSIDIHKDQMGPNSQSVMAATDFWGEYTLAKK